jgi:two-component system cell cycle sensor histidine kinase/response regulator CckA
MEADNPFRRQLTEVRSAGERCAELTQQLLAFSRKQIVRTGPLDLNQLIRESQGVLNSVLGDDIEIRTSLAPDLGAILADRSQMHQVLMNLAVNAREAMPGGGTLTIETRNVSGCSEVLLEIRDTGHGMDEGTRRHLFEPFFTTKQGPNNTGLGLAIVYGIVGHGGGRIEVHSELDQGSAFCIYLPRIQSAPVPEPGSSAAKPPHRGTGTVLVVEDRAEVRTLACRMVEELGYQTLAAASGAEALSIAHHHPYPIPLLMTDVVMPGMNGRELADQLRQLYPEMKAIFMSGYTDRILTNPHEHYLQKPFTLLQLAEILRQGEETKPD